MAEKQCIAIKPGTAQGGATRKSQKHPRGSIVFEALWPFGQKKMKSHFFNDFGKL